MTGPLSENPRGREAVIISSIFTGLALIIVILRLYTRLYIIRAAGIEDLGIALAMLCSIGLTICIGIQACYGMGKHIADVTPRDMTIFLRAFWSSLMVYYLSLGLTKGSMLLQYRRIFPPRAFQIANWTVMAVVICYTFWTVFSSIFACVPVRAFWTKEKANCINQFAMWFTNAAINILTDFAIILLPIPVIRSLNLGKRQKIGLISIFAVGGFVCIVSILRLQSLVAISNSSDQTYDNPPAATWSSVETNVGIICACLPLLRPLLTKYFPRAFPSRHRSNYSRPNYAATFGSKGGSKALRSKQGYALDVTKRSRDSTEDGRDIQVVTDIHVQVEGAEGVQMTGWKTPTSHRHWDDASSAKDIETASTAEMLVEQKPRTSR
ncbi:hypothetical protein yc1106_08948 [Curvularia clavata]|uniref:Rhodopsin domain-containing protein n=1 Tax=Curvularia clavata TaxID=95742 RepID=A0A9Q8ZFF3_CURCL|nr:hypothetical protein yc1106_08948 [Curvularia clavata]